MNIAVYGGTFDPPTLAHEAIIEAALDQSDIDQLWVMPSGDRLDKPGMSSREVRLSLLHLMVTARFLDDPRLIVSEFEMDLPQPSTTIETYRALHATYPQDDFHFIFGADSYQDMPHWQEGTWLQSNLGMLLVARSGYELPPESERVRHLPFVEQQVISSTVVRERVRAGLDISTLVNPLIAGRVYEIAAAEAVQ